VLAALVPIARVPLKAGDRQLHPGTM
jgi:hypothetical protein